MKKDLILERYNKTLRNSILQELETERIIRIHSLDNNFLNESLEDVFSAGAELGAEQGKAFIEDEIEFVNKYTPAVKKALEYLGLSKYTPVAGDIIALLSAAYKVSQVYLSANNFTNILLETANIRKEDMSSFIGQYSIFDASPEDIRMVAASLRQNINDENRKKLKEAYYEFFEELKGFIIDLALGLKTVSAGAGYAVAIVLDITPSERLFKNLLFKAHNFFNGLMSKVPDFMKEFLKIAKYISRILNVVTQAYTFVPIISFFSDNSRIVAFSEIDEIIDSEYSSPEELASYAGKRYGRRAGRSQSPQSPESSGSQTRRISMLDDGPVIDIG